MNIIAKKSRRDDLELIESVKTYDKSRKEIGFFQRLIQYIKGGEGQCEIGDWYKIQKSDYEAEDSPQITYDNHP